MSASGDKEVFSLVASIDLSTMQYKVVTVGGTISAANATAIGVLQNKPKSGESGRVAYAGHMKAYVGAAVTAGDELTVTTSGYLITNATSVSGIIGKCITTAASGALCEFIGDFSTARTSYSVGII